jgi:hypothetical protein
MPHRSPCLEVQERLLCQRLEEQKRMAISASQSTAKPPSNPRQRADFEFGRVYAEVVGDSTVVPMSVLLARSA